MTFKSKLQRGTGVFTMKKIFISIILLFGISLNAKILISPIDAMKYNFGSEIKIVKKNILLNRQQAKTIQKSAKVKIKKKIFKIYKAIKGKSVEGYGILINRKVRSKNMVALYIIDKTSTLKSIEIIAFNEPLEYMPSKKYSEQFKDVPTTKNLRVEKEVSTITGATLSARSLTDGSRLAFAIYNELLKER